MARARLDGPVAARIRPERINGGFAALKRGGTIRSVIAFDRGWDDEDL